MAANSCFSNSKLATRNSTLTAGVLAILAALPLGADVHAQILNDPTRPPAGVYTAGPAEGAAAGVSILQSVMITPTERSAIIGGERVKLGGRYGDARVIKITESEVVLRSRGGTETLRMYPDVTLKPVVSEPPAAKKPARKKRGPATKIRGKQG